jgi:putative SOS response-associated peptidase YedK
MCARYSLTKEQITMLIGEIEVIINIGARYNIAPTQIVPAIVRSARGIESVDMQWGFKSAWSRQPLINAKAETIPPAAKTFFRQAQMVKKRLCNCPKLVQTVPVFFSMFRPDSAPPPSRNGLRLGSKTGTV